VLDALDEMGLSDDTYVGFINDNGGGGNDTPEHTRNTACNAPLRGYKFDLYEGGVRVPMMLAGPGLPAGDTCRAMVSGMDFAPTFLAAAGVDLPEDMDGTDLAPFLAGKSGDLPHESLKWCNRYWGGEFQHQKPHGGVHNHALRSGRWKLVKYEVPWGEEDEGRWELYDLHKDIGEQHNLAPEYPELVRDLAADYDAWLAQMPAPLE
jgi:arylsulfatase A-like enzyme